MQAIVVRWILGAGSLVLLGLAQAARCEEGQGGGGAQEVPLDLLTVRERRFYLGGTNAFTGWVTERYGDGGLKSRSAVTNGLLEGRSEGWYSNSVKQVEEQFHAGVSHGMRIKWDEAGRLMSEARIVGGKIEGVFRRWHPNGVLAEEIAMRNNQPDGPSRAFFPSGCQKAEASMSKGQLKKQRFWKDGECPASAPVHTNAPAADGTARGAGVSAVHP